MQQIERYGVIALLLLLVTVLAVSMWGDDQVTPDPSTPTLASAPAKRRAEASGPQALDTRRAPRRETQDARKNRKARVDEGLPLTPTKRPEDLVRPRENAVRPARADTGQQTRDNVVQREPETMPAPKFQPATQVDRADRIAELQKARTNQPRENLASHATEWGKPGDATTVRSETPPARGETLEKSPTSWTVKRGETLSGIASKALGSAKRWREIADLNPRIDPNRIPVGATLVLPGGAAAPRRAPARTPAKDEPVLASAGEYVVRKGDMLSLIAQRELGSAARWREIQKLNPKINPDRLIVGTVLALPGDSKRAASETLASAAPAPKRSRVR